MFGKEVHDKFVEMSKNELFVVEADDIFERYLAAFPAGTNPIYRVRTLYDCQCCRQFVRRLGVVVSLDANGGVNTVWGGHPIEEPFKTVFSTLDEYIKSLPIKTVFRTKERQYGIEYNYDKKNNERHDHFFGLVGSRHLSAEPDTKRSEQEAIFQVLSRGLSEIKLSDIGTVLDLINQNELYRGEEHKQALVGFKSLILDYEKSINKDNFVWANLSNRNARFRNTVIGTLLSDLAEGKDLEHAVKSFETKVAPTNYKRTTSIITQKMVEDAVQTLNGLGLGGAIYRRFARLEDVSVNDVLFVDNSVKLKDNVVGLLESSIHRRSAEMHKVTQILAEDFVESILPRAKKVEVQVENKHTGNFVSLTAPKDPCEKKLFKWDNNFAWSYQGDVTDSVKQRVKAAGGNTNCLMRVSLSWFNGDDLDIHCITPEGDRIYFGNKRGILDVDMNAGGAQSRTPVENLAFVSLINGVYRVEVNQFRRRETIDFGFSIEVEHNGVLRQFSHAKALRDKETIQCFNLTLLNGRLSVTETGQLTEGSSSQDKWGVKTESLVPVTSIMYSPNHWSDQKIGAKHLIFTLKDCKNPEPTRGIYNEFLRGDLEKHRKVFEVLGSKTKCPVTDEQVSGVGFTAARGDSVTVVVDGRPYLIQF